MDRKQRIDGAVQTGVITRDDFPSHCSCERLPLPAVIIANPENPYAAPSDPESNQGQQHRSPLMQALLMLPFAVIAGAASGHVAIHPGSFLRVVPLHPMAEPGTVFGLTAAVAGTLLIPTRRLVFVIFIPFVSLSAFGISGLLLERVNLQMQPNGSVGGYAVGLSLASLAGMLLLGSSFWLTRMLSLSASLRFAVIGTVLGALCVAIVNCLPWIPSFRDKLYWTTFAWQFLMLEYLVWLSNRRRV